MGEFPILFQAFGLPLILLFAVNSICFPLGQEEVGSPTIHIQGVKQIQEEMVMDPSVSYEVTCTHAKKIRWLFHDAFLQVIETNSTLRSANGTYSATFTIEGMDQTMVGLYTCQEIDTSLRCPLINQTTPMSSIYFYLMITEANFRQKNILLAASSDWYSDLSMKPTFSWFKGQPLWIPCKPSNPNVSVTLDYYDEKLFFVDMDPKQGFLLPGGKGYSTLSCEAKYQNQKFERNLSCPSCFREKGPKQGQLLFIGDSNNPSTSIGPKIVKRGSDLAVKCSTQTKKECSFIAFKPNSGMRRVIASDVTEVEAVLPNVSQAGQIECWSSFSKSREQSAVITHAFEVKTFVFPTWAHKPESNTIELHATDGGSLNLPCAVNGYPPPLLEIFRDGEQLSNASDKFDFPTTLKYVTVKDSGEYLCKASNAEGEVTRSVELHITDPDAQLTAKMVSAVVALSTLFLIFGACFILWQLRKEMLARKKEQEIAETGNVKMLDQDRSPKEQADLLPYNKTYHVNKNAIIFERQIGVGAFGRVYRAVAEGVVSGEEKTVVAVKTIKSRGNCEQVKAFQAEVKILMYIGRHQNIVNLLGVCTEDYARKGELSMIVEYCTHSSIYNYIKQNESQLARRLQGIDSSASDDGALVNLQLPDSSVLYHNVHLYQNVCTVKNASRQTSEEVTKEDGGKLEVTLANSAEFIDWARQIANGMAFLAGKKIVHGDLAARNILLADSNIIKIADFGLAKDLYANPSNIYKPQKKGRLLAVRWAAVESIERFEFSTCSDVWAFGIVLWEIFSLGMLPYYWVDCQDVMGEVLKGNTLPRPKYANDTMYQVMQKCWLPDTSIRPSFEDLERYLSALHDKAMSLDSPSHSGVAACCPLGPTDYLPMCSPDNNHNGLTEATVETILSDGDLKCSKEQGLDIEGTKEEEGLEKEQREALLEGEVNASKGIEYQGNPEYQLLLAPTET